MCIPVSVQATTLPTRDREHAQRGCQWNPASDSRQRRKSIKAYIPLYKGDDRCQIPYQKATRNPPPCSPLACTCYRSITSDTGSQALTCPEAPIWAAWAWAACTAAAACCCWTSWALTLSMKRTNEVNISIRLGYDTPVSTTLTILVKKGVETRSTSHTYSS